MFVCDALTTVRDGSGAGWRFKLVHLSLSSKLCHNAASQVLSDPAELSIKTVNLTVFLSEGMVVVCPNGGWHVSVAYMSAVSMGAIIQGEGHNLDSGER